MTTPSTHSVSFPPLAVPSRVRRAAGIASRLSHRLVQAVAHPRRHRVALRRLTSTPPPRVLVFVCLGNICRSAYAGVRARQMLGGVPGGETVTVHSVGFLSPEGRPSPDVAVRVAAGRGVDLRAHRSRRVDASDLAAADLVVVMEKAHARRLVPLLPDRRPSPLLFLGDLDPSPGPRRAIVDPYGRPAADFDETFARIDRALAELLSACFSRPGARRREPVA